MRYVLCLLDPADRGLPKELRQQYEALPQKRGLEFAWRSFDHAAVLMAWDDPWGPALVATEGSWMAAGAVRLDNRKEAERWLGAAMPESSDLQLVLRLVARSGSTRIRDLLGDFAFVAWHPGDRTAVAATDALGIKKLFYSERSGIVAFASRAEALVLQERYEPQYLAELVALCPVTPELTAYAGIRRVPAGTSATLEQGQLMLRRYWSPEVFEPVPFRTSLKREAPERLRELLAESLRQRVSDNGNTWAQLSGGLDSSSIVSLSQSLVERGVTSHGIAGTVTYVDWQATDADEREYSDAVAARYRVRNEVIVDPPLWTDGHSFPPHLDQPRDSLAFYPREQQLCAIVRQSGGQVLLSGVGSDELFTGITIFFADWVVQGRIREVVREMARWAARGRVSFWDLAFGNAILPLVPRALRRPTSVNEGRLLPWVSEAASRRYELKSRTYSVTGDNGRWRRKYHDSLLRSVRAIATTLDAGAIGDALDVRYPFLSRPLVEFALQLPPELCAEPHQRKWVLREAMRGILPDLVRTRIGKGGPTDALVRSLISQHDLLATLVEAPLLADVGVVDTGRLRAAFETAPQTANADRELCTDVQNTLMVEAWLRIRAGRWPPGPPRQWYHRSDRNFRDVISPAVS